MIRGTIVDIGIPDLDTFLAHANARRRARLFTRVDYRHFMNDIQALREGSTNYIQHDKGSVANSYKYPAYTACYGMYITEDNQIYLYVGEQRCNGRHVSCFRHGGVRQYNADRRKWVSAKGDK